MITMSHPATRAVRLVTIVTLAVVTTWKNAAMAEETLHRKLDEDQKERFQSLMRLRKNASEEIAIFQRVYAEKQKEAAGCDARMMQKFNLDKSARYQFDAPSNALVRIEQRVAGGRTNLVRCLDRVLSREQGAEYLKEARGKNLVNQQMQVLTQLYREKSLERDFAVKTMKSEFGIDPAAQYRYDDKTGTILLLRSPDGGTAAGKPAPTAQARPLPKPAARKPAVAPAPGARR